MTLQNNLTPLHQGISADVQSDKEDFCALVARLNKLAPYDGSFDLTGERVNVMRASQTATERTYLLAQPSICIVPQGVKSVSLAQSKVEYLEDPSSIVVYAAEVPINLKIIEASPEVPYFCLMIPLQPKKINELLLRVFPNGVPKTNKVHAVYVENSDPKIIQAATRLLELVEQQEYTELLVPLVIDEILIRLLTSPVGPAIAQIGLADSHAEKITQAIAWLKQNYAKPIKMEELAKITGMSVSSFHNHFKAITSMSPLQFQKTLRLQEARSLMRTKMMDVSTTAFAVGYTSTSQFSREYAREFGVPPSKDIG